MKIEKTLDKIHSKVTKNRFLQIFTAFTRILLAIGFTPPSLVKIINKPFTVLPDSHPVGHYFNALYQTGFYYQFIGWSQLVAAILLLFPRTAHLGALMFLPIILNIAVLTNSVGFAGTWLITDLMLIAAIYLVCWDYDRIKAIFFSERKIKTGFIKHEFIILPLFFAFGGAALSSLVYLVGLANLHKFPLQMLIALTTFGFIFGLICALHHKFMRVGNLEKPLE